MARPPSRLVDESGLRILGVRAGEAVRWRSGGAGRWQHGVIGRRERDGSVGVTDADGAARSIAVDRLEVTCVGARGGRAWEPLTRRAGRSEQLSLLSLLENQIEKPRSATPVPASGPGL